MATSPLRKNKKQNQSNNKAPQTKKGNQPNLKISFDRPKYREMSFFDPKTKQKNFRSFFLKGRGLKKTRLVATPSNFPLAIIDGAAVAFS